MGPTASVIIQLAVRREIALEVASRSIYTEAVVADIADCQYSHSDSLTPNPRSLTWLRALHDRVDQLTEALIYFMVILSPWAFGTTQPWSISVMNACGYTLGTLLAGKWIIRWSCKWQPERWGEDPSGKGHGWRTLFTRGLAVSSVLVLAYCLISAVNARATFDPYTLSFEYRETIRWLPHSYDAPATWQAFWRYLALALSFWSVRDWLLSSPVEHASQGGSSRMSARMRRLLVVLTANGALLAMECLVQRALGTNKLLWLVEPWINKTPEAQYGPYAYRSNAAQYFLILWPVALGFWWAIRKPGKGGRSAKGANLLVPCILLLLIAPLASLSRGAAIIGVASCLAAVVLLVVFRAKETRWRVGVGATALVSAGLLLGAYMDWGHLTERLKTVSEGSGRAEIWRNTWQISKDYPVFGTGPGTFSPVYGLYRPTMTNSWAAYAHNDWLEVLATFGGAGSALVLAALLFGLAPPAAPLSKVFVGMLYIGLGSCLVFAVIDLPFRIYSVVFLFLMVCAVLNCAGGAKRE